jgi:hypothetical protein
MMVLADTCRELLFNGHRVSDCKDENTLEVDGSHVYTA